MPSTLTCIRREEGVKTVFDCRLITDGKKIGEWKVTDVEVISEEGKEISSEVETTLTSFIATTDDYFICEEKDGKLICRGSLTKKVVEKKPTKRASLWEKLFGGE